MKNNKNIDVPNMGLSDLYSNATGVVDLTPYLNSGASQAIAAKCAEYDVPVANCKILKIAAGGLMGNTAIDTACGPMPSALASSAAWNKYHTCAHNVQMSPGYVKPSDVPASNTLPASSANNASTIYIPPVAASAPPAPAPANGGLGGSTPPAATTPCPAGTTLGPLGMCIPITQGGSAKPPVTCPAGFHVNATNDGCDQDQAWYSTTGGMIGITLGAAALVVGGIFAFKAMGGKKVKPGSTPVAA